ncbi:DUF5985 family protein [Lysobacter auxotrophicus]|nr:DUF5985 family protein [Lysobacter auxotrophicus]
MFMLGMISMGSAVVALLFLRFWRISHERLFLWFAAAFLLEAMNRAVFAWQGAGDEAALPYLLARILFFLLIIGGVADKNLGKPAPR